MKSAIEWEEEDLLEVIRIGADENSSRDWKQAEALGKGESKKDEISKDVSSFANSDGGFIVYGIKQDKSPPCKAIDLTPIDPKEFPAEWLEDVIASRIKPPIQGLKIKTIKLNTKYPGKVAYLVSVPRSNTAHQASTKRYYRRHNFKAEAMEDYEIRLVMHRTTWPTYRLELRKTREAPADREYRFAAVVTNTSDLVAYDVSLNLLLPKGLAGGSRSYVDEIVDDDGYEIEYLRIPGSEHLTLYPGDPRRVAFEGGFLKLPTTPEARRCKLLVRVYDRFGRAHEAIFTATLMEPLEVIGEPVTRTRESVS